MAPFGCTESKKMMTISESTTSGLETSDSSALIWSNEVKPQKKRRLLIPQDMTKSESLKSKMPLSHLIKRQLKREGIKRMPSPYASSERDEKQQSLSSVKNAEYDPCSLEMRKDKERREKNDKKEALENGEGNGSGKSDCEDAGLVLKKKRLDARTYRAFLKHQDKKPKQSGASTSQADYGSQQLQGLPTNMDDLNTSPLPLITLNSSEVPEVQMTKAEGSSKVCCEQKSLYLILKPAMSRLCDTLELPEDVRDMVGNFLDHIMYNDDYTCYIKKGLMYNDHVNQESETMLHAFQISLCWMAASFLRHKLDRKGSLMLAKQHLNFECKQEEAESIYSKLLVLKKCLSHRTGALRNPISQGGQSSEQRSDHVTTRQTQSRTSKSSSSNELDLEGQRTLRSSSSNEQGQIRSMRSTSLNQQEPGERRTHSLPNASVKPVPVEQDQASDDKTTIMLLPHHDENLSPNTESFNRDCRELVEVCTRRRREIHLKQQEEIREFINFWKKEREKLKKDQRLESEFVSIIHDNPAIRSDKLKRMDEHFVRKLNEISMFKESIWNFFLAKKQHAMNREKRIQASRLETAESGVLLKSFADLPLSYSDLKLKSILTSEWSRFCSSLENVMLMSLSSSEPEKSSAATPEILDKHCGTHDNDHLLQNLESVNLTILDGICAEAQEIVSNAELEGINRESLTSAVHPIVVNEVIGEGVEEGATLESGFDASMDKHSWADVRDGSHSMSTQHQSLINIPPGRPSISPGQVNSISPHQLTSEQNQLTLSVEDESEHIPSCRRQDFPLQTEIALQPVDVASLQIEQSNDIPISRPNDQLQLHPSTDSLKVEPAMPFKLPPSTVGLSSECNQLDTCAITQSESEPRSEWCSSSLQTEVLTRQPMAATTSQVEQCVHLVSESSMQLLMPSSADIPFRGLHMEDPQETRLLLESMQTSLMISHRLPLPSLDPLNNELAKLHSKKEEGFKMHEDMKLRLATERDKEIEEVHRKYNKFIHDSEVLLMEKKKKLELMMDKVHLNKMLAEVVKPGFPHAKLGWQPSKSGMFSTLTQQFPMQSLQQNAQRPPRPPARPVQVVHHPSELFSSKAPVPHSSPIIPQHANHRINSDSRVLPLHHPLGLTSTSAPGDSLIRGISCQISPTRAATMQPLPSQFWPRIPHTMEASNGNQLRVHSSSLPSIHNSFPSAPELLTNLRNWSGTDRLQF